MGQVCETGHRCSMVIDSCTGCSSWHSTKEQDERIVVRAWIIPLGCFTEQVGKHWGRSRHVG